ncbi:DUF4058 family protein [Limnofasciculus baicalensis]|uniref:DUF4058 family protein n=1 Tax=Limnofasciculus baicalensis BBK-W-15 TaxID=2699891 RepID=A0AAE3GRW1_9CYAN|nr:DUF4058 family protein [Limnofasciculus baicalensis]MCP2729550.1 DUF4058 family protein [Limnofasciculus baicalensis BBK-W-15]
MASPFPGMNPYLEHPELWAGVHLLLIAALTDSLAPQLRPKYRVAVEVRIYEITREKSLLVGIPDVTIKRQTSVTNPTISNVAVAVAAPPVQPLTVTIPAPETVKQGYLEVREVATGEVVTAIEILSPVNKRSGEGRKAYKIKRELVFKSATHLVEIDLLRAGKSMPILDNNIESNYRILVSRSNRRPLADLYAFNLQNAIPSFPLPLQEGDPEPLVDLQSLLNGLYDRAGYDLVIDYSQEPLPALSEADTAWADGVLREQVLR